MLQNINLNFMFYNVFSSLFSFTNLYIKISYLLAKDRTLDLLKSHISVYFHYKEVIHLKMKTYFENISWELKLCLKKQTSNNLKP